MKYSLLISAIVLIFCSCADDSKREKAVFEATTESLEQSGKAISDITADYRKQLFDRSLDLRTAEQAAIWQPKAAMVSELVASTISYIDTLKSQLAVEGDNFHLVNEVLFQQKKGEQLHRRLRTFIDSIYTVDAVYADLVKEKFNYFDSTNYKKQDFTETFFSEVSGAVALSLLTKFKNDILVVENKVITFCYHHVGSFACGMDYFSPLVSISSGCVKAGDDIEITAGIGSFSKASQPGFVVDGKLFVTNENGVIIYKFKTPFKAGTYTKAVKLEYTKPDGTKESMTKNIEYTVINPNQNSQ